jgi:photosystem II stability/assembly factor-like uncharacterized protein
VTRAKSGGRGRVRWVAGITTLLILAVGGVLFMVRGGARTTKSATFPRVGADLHSVFVTSDAVFLGGHAAVDVSRDSGRTWQQIPSLTGADAMGWAATAGVIWVGGHSGLFRSSDGGMSFTRTAGPNGISDVHALGGAGPTVYADSPEDGLFVSVDSGRSWQLRNPDVGKQFMGTILVDPSNPARLVASDMSAGPTISNDGGRSWRRLGGPADAMAAGWNPKDTRQLISVGMGSAAATTDGGAAWRPINVPDGTAAVSFDPSGRLVYAAALESGRAHLYRSPDGGVTWSPTA